MAVEEKKKKEKLYKSLTKFKERIERDTKEKVLEFNGEYLITRRGKQYIKYGLYMQRITEWILEGYKKPQE